MAWTPAAQARKVTCRSFYLDLALLEDYWVRRKYHHTLSSTMIYALREALMAVEEEGLEAALGAPSKESPGARARARGDRRLICCRLQRERLWTLNAVRVPAGIDEAVVRQRLLREFNIEIGAGLGPLAGKIWRVGLMGASSTPAMLLLFLGASSTCCTPWATRATAAPRRGHGSAGRSLAALVRGNDFWM